MSSPELWPMKVTVGSAVAVVGLCVSSCQGTPPMKPKKTSDGWREPVDSWQRTLRSAAETGLSVVTVADSLVRSGSALA
jgi:hypothetical protein